MLAAIVSQNSFVLVFMVYGAIIARYVAKWGIAQMCLCETKYQGWGIAPFWGSANFPDKVSRDMGYRSDSIAISHDMGPLSLLTVTEINSKTPPQNCNCNPPNNSKIRISQGKTPWVDSACADCPGFLVLGAAHPLASTFVWEPQLVSPGLAFGSWALGHLLGSARSSPTSRAKTGRTAQSFAAQGGTRLNFMRATRVMILKRMVLRSLKVLA